MNWNIDQYNNYSVFPVHLRVDKEEGHSNNEMMMVNVYRIIKSVHNSRAVHCTNTQQRFSYSS